RFELPETVDVPIPDLRDTPMPVFGRTRVSAVDRSPLAAALLAVTPGDRSVSVFPAGRHVGVARTQGPDWATPPTKLVSIAPVRPAMRPARSRRRSWLSLGGRSARPIDLLALCFGQPTGWNVLRRLNARLRRGG